MQTFNITDYFRNIATQLKAISHDEASKNKSFFRVRSLAAFEEVLSNLRYIKFPAMVIMVDSTFRLVGDNIDTLHKQPYVSVFIINKINPNDLDANENVHESLDIIENQIIARIRTDVKKGTCAILPDTIDGDPIGPIADGIYGREYKMLYNLKPLFKIDPNQWNTPVIP